MPPTPDVIRALPGEATNRIADELDAFHRLVSVDAEMACIRALRAADVMARHIYSRTLGSPDARDMRTMVADLVREDHVPFDVAVAFEALHTVGQLAGQRSLDAAGGAAPDRELERSQAALNTLAAWLEQHGPDLVNDTDVEDTYVVADMDLTLEDVYQTIEVDRDAYGGVDSTYIPTREMVERWYIASSDIYTVLKDRGSDRVVGYINAMPVTEHAFSQILGGYFQESEFGIEEIQPYTQPGFYYLYFCSVAIRSEYRNHKALRQLLGGFVQKWARLAHQNIYLREIVADAVSHEGRRLCEAFGMKVVNESDRESDIFHLRALPPEFPPVTPQARSLRDFYAQLYLRYKDRLSGGDS